ncbi:Transcription factor Iwr1 [Pyrenophora seminiperda CCB06]|uniref:Transcription factor Iwr1 n=1 Tax=Pyrenophora seminiperda CCB06 TaxID=1302712 RepID=A0A3M7LXP6_9PLEO|nr:Transcription factor Iwr1 [Pyrenophora seminiperda CCB06]
MSSFHLPPQTISVKRKRTEAPIDTLRIDDTKQTVTKRTKYTYKRLPQSGDDDIHHSLVPPTPTGERRFRLDPVSRIGAKRHFIEEQPAAAERNDKRHQDGSVQEPAVVAEHTPSRPRKRPGAGSALHHSSKASIQWKQPPGTTLPSETDVRHLEALSQEVEKIDNRKLGLASPSPSKYKPKPPAKRFADRHPPKVTPDAPPTDADAMDIDNDEYVYDHYVREPVLPNAPAPTGPIGLLVIGEEDTDWWDADSASDREFDTDDEDENAEDYYANDYPEDELSDDDEFGREVYKAKHRHGGSDDEQWDAEESEGVGSGAELGEEDEDDEDDVHFKMTVPRVGVKKVVGAGYWGVKGEGE